MIFSGRVERIIPARGGRRQLLQIFNTIAALSPRSGQATDLKQSLKDASSASGADPLIFVASDFISAPGWEKPLSFVGPGTT